MMFLLRLIPEPWASGIVVGAVILAYLYGSVTGTGSERQRNAVKQLTQQNKVLTQDLINGSRVQEEIAREANEARNEITLLKGKSAKLEKDLRNKNRSCWFTPAERLRIERTLPLGQRQTYPTPRQ